MCLLIINNVTRPIISNDIVLLRDNSFSKVKDYLRVLSSDKRDGEISKSYFYFIVDRLRRMELLIDNAIGFKAILPFTVNNKGISLKEGIMYITNDKQLIYFNYYDATYQCDRCSITTFSCVPSLKKIARELDVKIRSDIPGIAWYELLEDIQHYLLEASISLRVKISEIGKSFEAIKVGEYARDL
ncbi:hypothetical protein SULI_12285 [Saccharolobus solfataricus]|nr:hypothetical protein [Saccharolobus solfataricus]AKA74566.1 hypothetical protein SULB_2425 [Saccharolobus solfataricus]AKA77262.1 hypothetical protein SULC_2422 [Saccharolobus solfataricus]AKA79954.1 hypothetical protein SULA_2424 [Saccharolobus solfataricus]AZF69040.1 hypothetical protein SULG_12285 [Saccharolobus solfataricus]AZF71660.1 hypothetical protein SULH_12285 [Saccharolobus solfataricus]